MRTFAVICRQDGNSIQLQKQIITALEQAGLHHDPESPQLVLAVGGDGTFLVAVHQYRKNLDHTAFIGVHSGTLGFFSDYLSSELSECLENIIHHEPQIDNCQLLEITVPGHPSYFALNEMRVENVTRTQILEIAINDEPFETFRGTGLCLCTQLGSTAYNRSLGGPVLQYGLPLLVLSEITGIHHKAYRSLGSPLILSDTVQLRLTSHQFEGAFLCMDHTSVQLTDETEITCRLSPQRVRIARYRPYRHMERLQDLF